MTRSVRCVLLCEDSQHEVFARRFLASSGYDTRLIRVVKAPGGLGAAEQFVRTRFPGELTAQRSRPNELLVVLIDGDAVGVTGRIRQLNQECRNANIPERAPSERVLIVVPTWNIETWFAYLDGQEVVEDKSDYPRLPRKKDCKRHASALTEMCRQRELREPAPPSLVAACHEYRTRLSH